MRGGGARCACVSAAGCCRMDMRLIDRFQPPLQQQQSLMDRVPPSVRGASQPLVANARRELGQCAVASSVVPPPNRLWHLRLGVGLDQAQDVVGRIHWRAGWRRWRCGSFARWTGVHRSPDESWIVFDQRRRAHKRRMCRDAGLLTCWDRCIREFACMVWAHRSAPQHRVSGVARRLVVAFCPSPQHRVSGGGVLAPPGWQWG